MKAIYLEHANITVNNLEESVRFFQTAFPHFKERGGGVNNGRKWLHLGDDSTYLALNESLETTEINKNYSSSGINHLGFVVENVSEVTDRLLRAGFERDYPKEVEKFRIRDYFADADGNQYEFIQYLSEDPKERNSYA